MYVDRVRYYLKCDFLQEVEKQSKADSQTEDMSWARVSVVQRSSTFVHASERTLTWEKIIIFCLCFDAFFFFFFSRRGVAFCSVKHLMFHPEQNKHPSLSFFCFCRRWRCHASGHFVSTFRTREFIWVGIERTQNGTVSSCGWEVLTTSTNQPDPI